MQKNHKKHNYTNYEKLVVTNIYLTISQQASIFTRATLC